MSSTEYKLNIGAKEHAAALLKRLQLMCNDKSTCDFVVKVENEELLVHRNILYAGSDYFRAMMSHSTVENQSGVVEIKGVEYKFVKKCIDYIYTGDISISVDECEELLIAATMMQLTALCEKIETFLSFSIDPTSFFHIRKLALTFHFSNLKQTCDKFAVENIGAIVKEHEFENLELEYIAFLVRSASLYSVDSRVHMALLWVKADSDNRKDHLMTLMENIDLTKLSHKYNRYLTENEPVCYESAEFLKSIHLVTMNSTEGEQASLPFSGKPDTVIALDGKSNALQAYRPEENSWTKMHDLNEEMISSLGCAAVVHEKFLYVFLSTKKAFRIDVFKQDSVWNLIDDMQLDHGQYLRAALVEDCIYVAGGNSVERFSIADGEWEVVKSDGIIINMCALAALHKTIFIIGGSQDGFNPINTVRKFSAESETWENGPYMSQGRILPAVVSYNGKLYVAGGRAKPNMYSSSAATAQPSAEIYDPDQNNWASFTSMRYNRFDFDICFVENQLLAISPKRVEQFSFANGKWEDTDSIDITPKAVVSLLLPPTMWKYVTLG